MSTTDSPWGDTGFGSGDDGFAQEPTVNEQQPTAERLRVDPISALPPIAPPPTTKRGVRPLVWIGMVAILLLVAAVIGVDWYLTSQSIEEQAFFGQQTESVATVEQPAQQNVSKYSTETAVDSSMPSEVSALSASQQTVPQPEKTSVAANESKQQVQNTPPGMTPTESPTKPSLGEPQGQHGNGIKTRTPPAKATGSAWVVQVFASPSRDDAEEWLQQLREQRVADGYIVEQKVKGQSWYRVRFGQFATRSEAEQAAQNRGFAQPWIARVR